MASSSAPLLIQQAPAGKRPIAQLFACERDCGFEGTFAAVEAHERHCDRYTCEHDCGFVGTFAEVEAHA